MNAALKYQTQPVVQAVADSPGAPADEHWFRVLATVLVAAVFATGIALMSVWMKLEIDQKYQKIDAIRITNSQLQDEINRLDAVVAQMQSLERVKADLAAAGIEMQTPTTAFFVDPQKSGGFVALSKAE